MKEYVKPTLEVELFDPKANVIFCSGEEGGDQDVSFGWYVPEEDE